MKTKFLYPASLIITLIFLSGCDIYSLHPLYSDEVLTYKKDLLGTYISEDEKDTLTFEVADNKDPMDYKLSFKEGNKRAGILNVHLVKLGNNMFLDFYPAEEYENQINSEILANHLLPVHTFSKINMAKGKITLYAFKGKWLNELIDNNQIRISHEKVKYFDDDLTVLTAPTKELQKFVSKYQNEKEAFDTPNTFIKIK